MNQLQEAYDIFRGAGGFKISYFGRIYALTLKRLMGGGDVLPPFFNN